MKDNYKSELKMLAVNGTAALGAILLKKGLGKIV